MTGQLLKIFLDQVAAQGPEALLPQNLSDDWLDELVAEANHAHITGEIGAGILAAVLTISGLPLDVEYERLVECVNYYSLSVTTERMSRNGDAIFDPPTLRNIFSADRQFSVRIP